MGFTKYAQLAVLDSWTAASGPLRRTAHRVDFGYTPRPGYLYVRSRAISSRCNDNHDEFPAPEIEAAWKTFLGKPAFVNHHNANHRRARGVVIAGAIHRDRNPDGTVDAWVELLHEIDAVRFPKLAKAIIEGRVNRTSMGVDVERSTCSACGNVATSPAEYCRHIPAMKGKKIRQRNPKTGKVEESIIREICAGLNFFENSFLVEDPADPTAIVLDKPYLHAVASHHAAPRASSTNMVDQSMTDAISSGDVRYGNLTGFFARALADRHQGQQVPFDHQDVSFGEPGPGVPGAEQAAAFGRHVGLVHSGSAQEPVHRVHARWPIAGVKNTQQPGGNRAPDQRPAVAGRMDARIGSGRQAEAWAAIREESARPGVARFGARRKVDLGQEPLDFRRHGQHCIEKAAITGEHAEPGEEIFAAPTGRSPVADHFEHVLDHPERYARDTGTGRLLEHPHLSAPDHGPYYVTRHPDSADLDNTTYHVLDREGRETYHHSGGYKAGMFSGHYGAYKDWYRLQHHAEPPEPGQTMDLIHEHRAHIQAHPPQFPHSMVDPRDEEIATRPDARVHKPEGYSPEDEYHGSYEVVKHPDTGKFHVIDNAGRNAGHWNGFGTQMQAERSRDYIEKRQRSKEIGKGIAEKLFGDVMEIMDPGGTPESRQSERNLHDAQELMTRYEGGRGQVKMDPEDEGGAPYYERHHYLPDGRKSGWYAKHYGGTHFGIYHMATGDTAHEEIMGLPTAPGEDYKLHPDYGETHLARDLKQWHGEEHGTRHYYENEQYGRQNEPRIWRWRRRQGLASRRQGRYLTEQEARDAARSAGALAAAPQMLADDGPLEEKTGLVYKSPADHPFFLAHPLSVDNLLHGWHDSTNDEKTEGKHWYPDGHYVAKQLGGGDAALGGGMISAYSPLTHWPANLFHAARSIREGRAVGPGEGLNVMESHQASGARILAGMHHSEALNGPKTKAFAHMLEHGRQTPEDIEAGTPKVVVDRHAISAAAGHRVSDEERLPIGPGKERYYNHVAGMYVGAAKIISQQEGREVTPEHLQATLWVRQQRKNYAEDSLLAENSAKQRGQFSGRHTRYRKNWHRWDEDVTEHGLEAPPNLHLTPGLPHPYGMRKAVKTAADDRITAPPYVDTLRQEQCPVCGESSVWTGQRCPVCGFVAPPSLFRDPDTSKAMQMRDQMENDPSQFPQGPADEAMGSFPDADNQLFHPDQLTPNGVPVPSGNAPDGLPQDEEEELQSPEELEQQGGQEEPEDAAAMAEGEQEEQEEEGAALVCPECGTQFGPDDEGAEEGGPCPACGKGILQGASPGKEQDSAAGGKVMAGSAHTAAIRAQQSLIESQGATIIRQGHLIDSLQAQLRFMAELAGVAPELQSIHEASVRRTADINNPGSPVPDPPAAPPTQTTEEALASGGYAPGGHSGAPPRGTGHTEDDPQRPGTTPGSTENVPAALTTTPITPGVEDQTPPATNLIDVTAPIAGTGGDSNPMPDIPQRRIETDVRIDPDPLKASGPGIGGVGNDGTAFPWVIGAREHEGLQATASHPAAEAPQGPPSEPGDASGARVMASMRLARLRVQAGLAAGDDLEVCAAIEQSDLGLHDIEHEIRILSQVAQRQPPPRSRPRPQGRPVTGARAAPAMSAPPQPAYSTNGGPVDAEDIFLD